MAKETQKAKIEQLESELEQALDLVHEQKLQIDELKKYKDKSTMDDIRAKYDSMVDSVQKLKSENERLRVEVERLKEENKDLVEHNLPYWDIEQRAWEKTLEENEELKRQLEESVQKIKNERRAGRKQKFTNVEIQTIKMYRLQGQSYRTIAEMFNCSVGTIYNMCKDIKNI